MNANYNDILPEERKKIEKKYHSRNIQTKKKEIDLTNSINSYMYNNKYYKDIYITKNTNIQSRYSGTNRTIDKYRSIFKITVISDDNKNWNKFKIKGILRNRDYDFYYFPTGTNTKWNNFYLNNLMPTIYYNINSDLEDWNINRNYRKDKDKFINLNTKDFINESITFNDGTELYLNDERIALHMALKNNIFYIGSSYNFGLGKSSWYYNNKKLVEISSKYN